MNAFQSSRILKIIIVIMLIFGATFFLYSNFSFFEEEQIKHPHHQSRPTSTKSGDEKVANPDSAKKVNGDDSVGEWGDDESFEEDYVNENKGPSGFPDVMPTETPEAHPNYLWNDFDNEEDRKNDKPINKEDHKPKVFTDDWSKYAYIQVVSDPLYLCNSIMMFEQLKNLEAKPNKVLLYPSHWDSKEFQESSNSLLSPSSSKLEKPSESKEEPTKSQEQQKDEENKEELKSEAASSTPATPVETSLEAKIEEAIKKEEEMFEDGESKPAKHKKRLSDDDYNDKSSNDNKIITSADHVKNMLKIASEKLQVTLKPVDILNNSPSKLVDIFSIYNQTEYDRVLFLDPKGSIQLNMDNLFLVPGSPVVTVNSYWLSNSTSSVPVISPSFQLIQPSLAMFYFSIDMVSKSGAPLQNLDTAGKIEKREFDFDDGQGVSSSVTSTPSSEPKQDSVKVEEEEKQQKQKQKQSKESLDANTDSFNLLFHSAATILAPKPYFMVSSELTRDSKKHTKYLDSWETWDVNQIMNETMYIHFYEENSDFPCPWIKATDKQIESSKPACGSECAETEYWLNLYRDFEKRRLDVCQLPLLTVDKDGEYSFA